MKSLVVYKSKSGYTKRYMEMLSDKIGARLIELSRLHTKDLLEVDAVVYAGGVYAGKISGLKKFSSIMESQDVQRVAIVAVGASSVTESNTQKLMSDNGVSEIIKESGAFFYLQGGFDPDKLNIALRTMLGMVSKKLIKKQKEEPEKMTQEDLDFLDFFQTTNDHTSEDQLAPIINYIS